MTYHHQSNGLCERQSRTTKVLLVKVLDGNHCDWPNIIKGVLFAQRVNQHTSTKFYQEPTLPVNVKHSLVGIEENESEHLFDKETFDAMLTTVLSIRANMHQTAGENICSAQEKQHRDYNQRHQVPNKIKVGQKAFLKNQRRVKKKVGKFLFKWSSPFTVHSTSKKNLCTL